MTHILLAILVIMSLALLFGSLLGYVALRLKINDKRLVNKINALLPQTQCGQCGFAGCQPYADAIAHNEAAINRCPPGGKTTIYELADLLGTEPLPLNPEHGVEKDLPYVAYIREEECIGCTKCIQACPVDAILGAAKLMHTVIADECTGCDLCVEPCPVDCIDMIPVKPKHIDWIWDKPQGGGHVAFNRIPVSSIQ